MVMVALCAVLRPAVIKWTIREEKEEPKGREKDEGVFEKGKR